MDSHRPKTLNVMDYHLDLSTRLSHIAETGELPHLLFYGPSGGGKKTRIMALLREIYGPGVEKLKLEHRTFKTPAGKSIELTTLGSNYHIEMNPSDAGRNDRFVVQEIVKEIAQYHPVLGNKKEESTFASNFSSSSTSTKNLSQDNKMGKGSFKVVVLSDADSLTKDAQHALRRTMEKYMKTCRLILSCENISKIIDPLKSRCLAVRVGAPTEEEICGIVSTVATKERVLMSAEYVATIAKSSGRNLRRALLMAEAYGVSQDEKGAAKLPDWEVYVSKLSDTMILHQNPSTLLEARAMLYELLANCIPASVILEKLVEFSLRKLDDELKHSITKWAAYYEHRLQQGNKDIYHLEAFVAKFMVEYKDFLIRNYG